MWIHTRKSAAMKGLFALVSLTWLSTSIAYPQSSATVNMDHATLTAGETANLYFVFDKPTTCAQTLRVYTENSSRPGMNMSVIFLGTLSPGQTTTTATARIPKDYSGEFHSSPGSTNLLPCDGYSIGTPISTPIISFNVSSLPDTNIHPGSATVALSLSQKQFLSTKIVELTQLSGQIDTWIERNGSDTTDLRSFLASIVEKGEENLLVTERQYRSSFLATSDPVPPFFEDFRRQYSHLHDEIKAPIPGTRAEVNLKPRFVYVQQTLKKRTPPATSGRNLSGTAPAIARATKATLNDNAAAYNIINSTGKAVRPEFHARFASIPDGASIYYRQAILPDFTLLSSKTNIPAGSDFTLATSVFKFHKDECIDEPVVTIDPYSDTHPDISVEFSRCAKR